jgi:hypothetical protein
MDKICMIGLEAEEVEWARLLVSLLRHPDPVVTQVTLEALRYLEGVAARADDLLAAG